MRNCHPHVGLDGRWGVDKMKYLTLLIFDLIMDPKQAKNVEHNVSVCLSVSLSLSVSLCLSLSLSVYLSLSLAKKTNTMLEQARTIRVLYRLFSLGWWWVYVTDPRKQCNRTADRESAMWINHPGHHQFHIQQAMDQVSHWWFCQWRRLQGYLHHRYP